MHAWMRFRQLTLLPLLLLSLLPTLAFGHASSQAYLQLQPAEGGALGGVSLRADLALRVLDAALDLDANGDGQLSWGEVRLAQSAIERFVVSGIKLQACAAGFSATGFALETRADGVYAALSRPAARCATRCWPASILCTAHCCAGHLPPVQPCNWHCSTRRSRRPGPRSWPHPRPQHPLKSPA